MSQDKLKVSKGKSGLYRSGVTTRRSLKQLLAPSSLLVMLVAFCISIPLIIILFHLFWGESPNWEHIQKYLLKRYIFNTLYLIAGILPLSFILGVSCAWFVAIYEFPGRKFFEWALVLPLATPTYVAALSYSGIFGSKFQSMWGAILLFSFVLYPYVYLLTRTALLRQSGNMFEVARSLGLNGRQSFFRVGLPLTRPAIAGGLSLVLMETLNDYGAFDYFGINTFTTGIFKAWLQYDDGDADAMRLSACLLTFVIIVVITERLQRGKAKYSNKASSQKSIRRKLSTFKAFATSAFLFLVLFITFILPVGNLFRDGWYARELFRDKEFYLFSLNSILLAIITACLIAIIGLFICWVNRLHKHTFLFLLKRVCNVGYAIPGAVIAIGVMVPFIWTDRHIMIPFLDKLGFDQRQVLHGTFLTLIFAYIVRFLSAGISSIDSGYQKIGSNISEASKSLGYSDLKTLLKVELPLLKTSMITAIILGFVDLMKELPLTMILRPTNFDTLATKTFEKISNEQLSESSIYAIVIIFTCMIPIIILNKVIRREK
ncbi:MAG: iron ABC transporter permease [Lentisphaeria bacterium]|nr:iron ABC transporter permease [Lentisphaeria bacterium]